MSLIDKGRKPLFPGRPATFSLLLKAVADDLRPQSWTSTTSEAPSSRELRRPKRSPLVLHRSPSAKFAPQPRPFSVVRPHTAAAAEARTSPSENFKKKALVTSQSARLHPKLTFSLPLSAPKFSRVARSSENEGGFLEIKELPRRLSISAKTRKALLVRRR